MAIREYFILGSIGILCVFSLAIGVEKMMKIILGNYLLIALCLTLSPSIDAMMVRFGTQAPDVGQTISPLFSNKTIVVLVVYLVMLLLLFLKSRISINFHVSGLKRAFLTVIGIPLTVVSIATTLQIAVLGVQAFDMVALQALVSTWPLDGTYKQFIVNTPIVICLHAFVTIFILSTINWIPKINLRRKASLPDISLEDEVE